MGRPRLAMDSHQSAALPTEFGANKLLAAKRASKRAKEDHQLLQNRLHRLEAEEARAAAKIEETRKRAVEILALKKRNLKAKEDRKIFDRRREEEATVNRARAAKQREAASLRVQAAQSGVSRKKREDVLTTRKERQEHEMKIQRDRDAQLAAAAQSKAMIKAHEQNVHLASHKHRMQKTECHREEFQQKYEEEQMIRIQTEQEVRDMEQREAELIARLKQTQENQRSAYEKLEEVLNLEGQDILNVKGSQLSESLSPR